MTAQSINLDNDNVERFAQLKLTLGDVVNALCDYDVLHQPLPNTIDGGELYGLFDPSGRRIYVRTNQDRRETQDTVIHEFYHAKFRQLGMDNIPHSDVHLFTKLTLHDIFKYDIGRRKAK